MYQPDPVSNPADLNVKKRIFARRILILKTKCLRLKQSRILKLIKKVFSAFVLWSTSSKYMKTGIFY